MLNRDNIVERLRRGDIFRPGSWDIGCLSSASYDLRIADDFHIDATGTRHPTGRPVQRIVLEQGDVAMVSTKERFCVPWDLVGNMSPKFSFAKRGLLVHTGSIVDPGFGLRRQESGEWMPAEDERVHFFIANVGDQWVELRPGDKIATVQFNALAPPSQKKEGRSKEKLQQELFDGHDQPLSLAYFAWLKRSQATRRENEERLEEKLAVVEAKLADVKAGYQQLIFFGIYVLAAALLTIFGSLILQAAPGQALAGEPASPWPATLAVGIFLTVLLLSAFIVWRIRLSDRAAR